MIIALLLICYIKINCYAIDKFFVEVVYDAQYNVITEVRSFKYGHELDSNNMFLLPIWDINLFFLNKSLN